VGELGPADTDADGRGGAETAEALRVQRVELDQRYVSGAVLPDGVPAPPGRDPELFHRPSTEPGVHFGPGRRRPPDAPDRPHRHTLTRRAAKMGAERHHA